MAANSDHLGPYERFTRTDNWAVLDRAVTELVQNSDLQETTAHEYVVGYLCKALAEPQKRPEVSREEMRRIIHAAQKAVLDANPTNRDLLAEFLAERREEAARE